MNMESFEIDKFILLSKNFPVGSRKLFIKVIEIAFKGGLLDSFPYLELTLLKISDLQYCCKWSRRCRKGRKRWSSRRKLAVVCHE